MTNAIYRITVMVEDYQELALTGEPISVAPDRGGVSDCFDLWFEHTDEGMHAADGHRTYPIWVFGTGHPVPWLSHTRHKWRFLGTVVTASGLVWHIYTGPARNPVVEGTVVTNELSA